MSKIEFVLKLDQVGAAGNAARMWLDTSRDDVLQTGEEITLATLDGKIWIGSKRVSGATAGMQFLTKFAAPAGTTWSFVAVSDGGALYKVEGQVMGSVREQLAGRLA